MTIQPERTAAFVGAAGAAARSTQNPSWCAWDSIPRLACACDARGGCSGVPLSVLTKGIPHGARGCAAGSAPSGKR